MTVRTLSRWVDRLLDGRVVIECPHMEIIGRDHEPPVFTGPGHIVVEADTRMHFVMHGTPRDEQDAWMKYLAAKNHPGDIHQQFRMNAIGYDGVEWSGGWTTLWSETMAANVWRLSGPIHALQTDMQGYGVAEASSVELAYDRKLRLPLPMNMVKSVQRGDKEVLWSRSAGTKTLDVLGTQIEFFQSAEREHVWAVANTSAALSHPYLENWLSEPLNLLLGEVVAPRLKCRNFGNGKAMITLRQNSGFTADNLAACILRADPLIAGDKFWRMYTNILVVVAHARDASGHPNFEAHPLTQYYWEIIQASKGTNWVLCMTLASTIEGIAKHMFSEVERKSDWSDADVESLKNAIKAWEGNNDLRSVVLNNAAFQKTKGIARSLKSLVSDGGITQEQVDAWQSLRNSSMHGEMVMPWADEEQAARIHSLVELTHRLSETYIYRELEKLGIARA
ncbi:MAG: hypothetical protein QM599_11905 [Pseudoxanthomonas sp.]